MTRPALPPEGPERRRPPSSATPKDGGAAAARGLSYLFSEWRRRKSLASQPQPDDVAQPDTKLLWGELASLALPAFHQLGHKAEIEPTADPRAVMLIPGFGSHPWRMTAMRKGLEAAGHSVADWGLGWNLGASEDRFEAVCRAVTSMSEAEGRPLVLVGWSLGGVFAREIAKRLPERVEKVITLGSPFSGDMHGNNAWRIYHWIAGHAVDEPPVPMDFADKPPVPTIALWSARDGIVHRRCASGRPGERDVSIPVRCTHMGFAWHPEAIAAVADAIELDISGSNPHECAGDKPDQTENLAH